MTRFYNPKKLLNTLDRNNCNPEIFISISNRGAGKTYGFGKVLMEDYVLKGKKIALLCRWQRELGSVADGIFKALFNNEYPGYSIEEKVMQRSVYAIIYLVKTEGEQKQKTIIGYVLPINGSDNLKKISSIFYDVEIMFFDEFQADMYCPGEVDKFINIHFTVARGNKEGVRFVPVILASNSLSIVNPYFVQLGLSTRIQSNTKMYRGDGFVLERFVNADVAQKQKESPFNRAFGKNRQTASNIDNSWLNDSWSCVEKPSGRGEYLFTLIDDDLKYGVRIYENPDGKFVYVNRSVDDTCKEIYNISENGVVNVPVIKSSPNLLLMRKAWLQGKVLFSDIEVKDIMLKMLY